jgi:hypothetical protein
MTTPTIRVETSETSSTQTKDKFSQAKVKLQEFEKKVRLAKKALKHVDAAQRTRIGTVHKENNNNILPPRTMNNNNLDIDDSVEEIESSQRVSQLYEMPINDPLNETIPFNNKALNETIPSNNKVMERSEKSVEEEGEAFDEFFTLVISLEDHCVICNTNIADLNAAQRESHVNECIDAQEEKTTVAQKFLCIICGKDLTKYNEARRTQHVNRCVDESESQTPRNESQGSTSAAEEQPQGTYGSIIDAQWFCLICSKDFSSLKIKGRMTHLKACAKKNSISPNQLKTLQEQLAGKPVVRPMQSTPAKPSSKLSAKASGAKKKNVVMDITHLNLQKKSPPEAKEKKQRRKKVITSAYFDNVPSEPTSDDDFKTPVKKKANELRLSGDVPKDEAEEKIMLALALSASEKFSSPPSSNGSTPRDLAGFSVKNTPEKSLDLEEELFDDIPSTPQIKQSALQDKYKKSAESSPSIWTLQAGVEVDVDLTDTAFHTDVIPSSQREARPPLKLVERLVAVESVRQKTTATADEETQSSQLLFMAEALDDHKERAEEGDEVDKLTEWNNEESEAPVFAKPKPKKKSDAKPTDSTKPNNAQKPQEPNLDTPPHIISAQKVRVVREQEEELNSMLDEWESENQYASYEALTDEAVHPFLRKPKPTLVANQQRKIDLTDLEQPSPASVDDSTTIVSLSQFMERPSSYGEATAISKPIAQPTKPKALPRTDQSSPSEEDRVVADKVTEIVLEYQRLIQTKKRELAIRMKALKDEYYKEIGRLTVEKDKKINMVRKQYSVNTSVDSEEDFDSTFSSSIPTPVNTKEQEGGFMAPTPVENEEDKPFFTRKRSSLPLSMESDNNDEVDSMLPTPPDYESMSLEQLKNEVSKFGIKPGAKAFMVGQLKQLWKLRANSKCVTIRCKLLTCASYFREEKKARRRRRFSATKKEQERQGR